MIEAYPLNWPEGRPRTPSHRRTPSRFEVTFGVARNGLVAEIERLGGKGLVVSSNVNLKRDGLPYAGQKEPEDPGVAVYFIYKGKQMCFACDRWKYVKENIQAIRKTIEALRGIARWGTGDMMEAAFTGFEALPAPAAGWRADLELPPDCRSLDAAQQSYLRLRSVHHPDKGGNAEDFYRINRAIAAAEKELGS